MSNFFHQYTLRVYYDDTDAGGIVYHANYLIFFERARTEWLRELGVVQSSLLTQDIAFVVRKVQMDNLTSAKFDDLLTVKSQITQTKKASIVFSQKLYNQAGVLICQAEVLVACVRLSLAKPCAIPTNILGVLKSAC